MLWSKLSKSLIAIIAVLQVTSAVAQSYNIPRSQSSEPLPTLIIPQDGMIPRSHNQKTNRIQINSIQWSAAGKSDKINVYSDLTYDFIRTYNFRIIPSMTVNGKTQNLADGTYYIRAVILRPNLDDDLENFDQMTDQFMTSSERVATIKDGIISTYVTFSFPSPTIMTIKNRLFIEVIPLQQNTIKKVNYKGAEIIDIKNSKFVADTKYPTVVLSIPFLPSANGDSVSTVNKDLSSDVSFDESIDLGTVIAEGTRKLNERLNTEKTLSAQEWAKKNRTQIVINDSIFRKYESIKTREDACHTLSSTLSYRIPKFRNSTVEIKARYYLKSFCNETEGSVTFQKIHFVNENSQMTLMQRNGSMSQLGVSLTKGSNTSNAYDQSSSYSAGISLTPLAPLEAFFKIPGISVTANRNFSVTESLSHSQFVTGVTMENFFLEVNRMALDIKASDVRTCYLLKINKNHSRFKDKIVQDYVFRSFGETRSWGSLVCQTKEYPAVIHENYFHVLPAFKGQLIAESTDPRNQIINMSLRGYQELNLLKYQIRKFISKEYQSQIMPHDVITSTVAAQTSSGIQFTTVDLDPVQPGFIERTFYKGKEVEQP